MSIERQAVSDSRIIDGTLSESLGESQPPSNSVLLREEVGYGFGMDLGVGYSGSEVAVGKDGSAVGYSYTGAETLPLDPSEILVSGTDVPCNLC